MSDAARLTTQVIVSIGLVVAVLWGMWRLPHSEKFYGWAPPLSLAGAWSGLLGAIASSLLWVLPNPDAWVAVLFLVVDPLALTSGILVLWIYRGNNGREESVRMHRLQSIVGMVLGGIAVTLGYVYVMTHKTIGSAPGM
ncbi:MAG: hypothetical protein K8S99_00045 [Planctomycetes bacterium]|nr:hypothetical protein [Planctomycetota bacterium]